MQRKVGSRDWTLKTCFAYLRSLCVGIKRKPDGWQHLSLQDYSEDK